MWLWRVDVREDHRRLHCDTAQWGNDVRLEEKSCSSGFHKEQPTGRLGLWEREHSLLLRWSREEGTCTVGISRHPGRSRGRTKSMAVLEMPGHGAAQD